MPNIKLPMSIPGCYRICDEDKRTELKNEGSEIYHFIRPLIHKLLSRNPGWEFHSKRTYVHTTVDGVPQHAHFYIVDGDDELGWINCTNTHHGTAFEFDNHRLTNKRTRGSSNTTVDINKAFKTIVENIYGLTVAERLARAQSTISSQTNNHFHRANNLVATAKRELENQLIRFTLEYWDAFKDTLKAPKERATAERFPEMVDHMRMMNQLNTERTGPTGRTVVLHGSLYLVASGLTQAVFTSANLPDAIRTGVGILKLMEINTPAPGIGIRVSEKEFLVLVPEEPKGV